MLGLWCLYTTFTYARIILSMNTKVKVLNRASYFFGIDNADLLSHNRTQSLSNARHVVAYAFYAWGFSYVEISHILCRSHSAIIYACKHVRKDEELLRRAHQFIEILKSDIEFSTQAVDKIVNEK